MVSLVASQVDTGVLRQPGEPQLLPHLGPWHGGHLTPMGPENPPRIPCIGQATGRAPRKEGRPPEWPT